jgi:CheY-like chemotaxis protein
MREIHILLLEDSRGNVLPVRAALASLRLACKRHVVADGAQALDFMACMRRPGEAPCPDFFLLDLKLPRVEGHEVLREFPWHPGCATIPLIVVSPSVSLRDRLRASARGVDRYFKKPTNFEGFMHPGIIVKELTRASDPGESR